MLFGGTARTAAQPVYLELTMASHKFKLGLPGFDLSGVGLEAALAVELRDICKSDLLYSRLFEIVEKGPPVRDEGEARRWAELGTDVVVSAVVNPLGATGQFELRARLHDSASGRLVAEIPSSADVRRPAPAAHRLADEIVRYFTGRPGVAQTRIAFVNDSTGHKELYVMDYDGRNAERLTDDRSIVLFPRFSPDGKMISFTSYASGNPDLFVIGADGSGRRMVSSQAGLNTTASWPPDGGRLAVTLSMGTSAPNIHLIDLSGRVLGALTRGRGASTAPDFSPDGARIVYTSDAPGFPQIYLMSADGTGQTRLTRKGHCDSARFCPAAPVVAYVKGGEGTYDIFVMDVATREERQVTSGDGDSENPAWSPNGSFIVYSRVRGRERRLVVISSDGSDPRPVETGLKGRFFMPDWK